MASDSRPFYRIHTFVCTTKRPPESGHPSCGAHAADDLREYMKTKVKDLGKEEEIRINGASCLGRCDIGPVLLIYPEGVWYSYKTREDIDEILDTHILKGGRVTRLLAENVAPAK